MSELKRKAADVDKWLEDDNLLLLECWVRDGYTLKDIANRIGVTPKTLCDWKSQYKEIDEAIRNGKEIVDYKVENALLKAALGYKTKEVKVTTTMRYGKVVETIKEVTEKEQAPNVTAIQTWLYNRCKSKWKNMSGKSAIFDEMQEDTSIEITVRRAEGNEATVDTEKEIQLRKRTKSEQEAYDEEVARKHKEDEEEALSTTEVEEDEEWPEDEDDE